MFLRTAQIKLKTVVGKKIRMSLQGNRAAELWKSFMPQLKDITNRVGTDLYSVEVYEPGFFTAFDPSKEFEKWAGVEVADGDQTAAGMEVLTIPTGQYAVFQHRGPASEAEKTYGYIFRVWLPSSGYTLDDRPHFAVMGGGYRKDDPESEEEIWIPVRPK
jgi:AraC family transcriptional regulator